jgi:hypothetical protein
MGDCSNIDRQCRSSWLPMPVWMRFPTYSKTKLFTLAVLNMVRSSARVALALIQLKLSFFAQLTALRFPVFPSGARAFRNKQRCVERKNIIIYTVRIQEAFKMQIN